MPRVAAGVGPCGGWCYGEEGRGIYIDMQRGTAAALTPPPLPAPTPHAQLTPTHSPAMADSDSTSVSSAPTFPVPATKGSARKRWRGRRVLDEDEYAAAVERIIERDYFPSLPRKKLQLQYWQALEDNDVHAARAVATVRTLCLPFLAMEALASVSLLLSFYLIFWNSLA